MPAEHVQSFSVRQAAWHGLSKVLDEYPGREEAMKLAGHDWNVIELPINTGSTKIEGWKALQRSDTGKIISVVKDSYQPIQNAVLWDIVDAIVAQPNVKYETAGVLREGATLWVMAKLDEPWQVPGDDSSTVAFIMATTAHDATHSTSASGMNVRVVCWNTWQMAVREAMKKGMYYAFRHTANVQQRLDEAKEALTTVRRHFDAYKELTLELARHPVNRDKVTEFIMRFIPDPPKELATQRAVTFVNDARAKFAAIMGSQTIPEAHKQTAYGLWCAGVEFLDHERAYRTNETYFRRCTEPNRYKDQLGKLALEVAQ